MKRKQQTSKLIPQIPFTFQELNEHVDGIIDISEKIMEFSKTDAYKFLSSLEPSNIKKPVKGAKLSKRELDFFNEYIKYRSSAQFEIFNAIRNLVDNYYENLNAANSKGRNAMLKNFQDENETIIDVTDKDEQYDYAKIADKVDHKGRKYRVIQEIDAEEYSNLKYALKYRARGPGIA